MSEKQFTPNSADVVSILKEFISVILFKLLRNIVSLVEYSDVVL